MSIIDTDLLGDGLSSLTSKFHYGHHPSIIMWSNGPAVQKEEQGFFGATATALESVVSAGEVPEISAHSSLMRWWLKNMKPQQL